MALTLIIGNKTYSSWSLRPWLAMRQAGLDFSERMVLIDQPDSPARLLAASPSGKVPVLIDGHLIIPESLAILEYVAELAPKAGLLPEDRSTRALCRAVASEMHAGFAALRSHCPMNLRRQNRPRLGALPAMVEQDIARIQRIWNECRARFRQDGPFLFGQFTIADAMFAPVTTRFTSYGLPRDEVSEAYINTIRDMSEFRQWQSEAVQEPASPERMNDPD